MATRHQKAWRWMRQWESAVRVSSEPGQACATHQARTEVARDVLLTNGHQAPEGLALNEAVRVSSESAVSRSSMRHSPGQDWSSPWRTSHKWPPGTRRPAQQACASAGRRQLGPGPGSSRPGGCGSCRPSARWTGPSGCKGESTVRSSVSAKHSTKFCKC